MKIRTSQVTFNRGKFWKNLDICGRNWTRNSESQNQKNPKTYLLDRGCPNVKSLPESFIPTLTYLLPITFLLDIKKFTFNFSEFFPVKLTKPLVHSTRLSPFQIAKLHENAKKNRHRSQDSQKIFPSSLYLFPGCRQTINIAADNPGEFLITGDCGGGMQLLICRGRARGKIQERRPRRVKKDRGGRWGIAGAGRRVVKCVILRDMPLDAPWFIMMLREL